MHRRFPSTCQCHMCSSHVQASSGVVFFCSLWRSVSAHCSWERCSLLLESLLDRCKKSSSGAVSSTSKLLFGGLSSSSCWFCLFCQQILVVQDLKCWRHSRLIECRSTKPSKPFCFCIFRNWRHLIGDNLSFRLMCRTPADSKHSQLSHSIPFPSSEQLLRRCALLEFQEQGCSCASC